ncbi:ABC-F family ATP-binding cassette domain-containing protein [Kineothrix sp. MB12-C1]|uniref:ABC-F family ATP-binding cassette domain-containing protein n=1 Tax=Kineothrix sp. MB12-C1 TaxID=3070215 RepID=UPI0027D271FC|nr:ABC-F family ATP-binding cassette domain-containing protein [Kineothrix sp. MB12-C1]WMC92455.1 ABC-F family ATP-binding cassette domain-containing protein [Kineothrix sp. MB12-C1]
MVLSCQNISKAFNEKSILKNISFHIEDYDKAAIVGINGAGKTTLLRIIVGELSADEGVIAFSKDKTFGYLSQHQAVNSANTIYDELLSVKQDLIHLETQLRKTEAAMKSATGDALEKLMESYSLLTHQFELGGGYAYRSELIGVLKGLGFAESEFDKSISTLSGGQKTRVALGKLLLLKPDLIMLDEPTNHLDMSSIAWLETYLLNYKGAVIIVSHDRYFLDRISNKIIELDQTKSTVFSGNYSEYAVKKEQLRTAALKAYLNQQQEIKHQEEVIAKLKAFNREKSIRRAESREKMLDKIEVIEKPTETPADMHIHLEPKYVSGNDVLHCENLSKSFGDLTLFENINFDIKRGEHIAIIGDNGTGKTTILKIINGLLPADTGTLKTGTNVHIGYYDQEHNVLHKDKTLFEEISDDYPTLNNTEIRNTLAAFLFTGEDVFKRIGDLSGGERGRVSLAKLMLSESNLLILDEPTNHLDIASKEILEDALNSYTGTVIYVSHDRYFINRTATRILELSGGNLINYLGNYDYYLEKKPQLNAPLESSSEAVSGTASASKQDWKDKKEQQAKLRKRENELKRMEDRIEVLENRDIELDELMASSDVCTNVPKLQELSKEKESIVKELEQLMNRWEELSSEQEQ